MDKLMKRFSFTLAARMASLLFGLFTLFHASVILGIVVFDFAPVDFLWGGQLKDAGELLRFELLSLAIITLCLLTVWIRTGRVHAPRLLPASRFVLWILTGLFLLNSIGNVLAKTPFEQTLAVVTLLLTVTCGRMALEPISSPHPES